MDLKTCLTAAAAVMLTASLAYGLHPKLSLEEIAQNADLIFVGTVTRQNSHYNAQRTMIETDVTFTDVRIEHETDRAKQRGANTIHLSYAGGTVGNVSIGVSDSPRFETGRRYLVFMIDDDSRPFNPVVGADQGMFEVIADPVTGQEYPRGRGRRAVVGVAENDDVRSTSRPLERMSGGVPTFAASAAPVASPMAAPEPIGPGAAVTSRRERVTDATLETPMTIDLFVDHVKNVSLKKQIDRPKIVREGRGTFYRMVNGAIVAEPIKETALQVETIDEKIRRAGLSVGGSSSVAAGTDATLEGQGGQPDAADPSATWYLPLMNCGKRQSWPFTMEIPLEFIGKEFWAVYDGMNIYNNYVDLFRPIGAYPGWGRNNANEFLGYPSSAELIAAYGRTWSGLAVTISIAIDGWCNKIVESDIFWNPGGNWTDNYFVSFQDIFADNINTVTMHELGHTVGLSRAGGEPGGHENYSYPYLTHMHALPFVMEDGRGLHAAEAINLRANYGSTTNIADMGVEAYYANGWGANNSWLSSPRPDFNQFAALLRPGDTFTVNELTVENMSQFAHSNPHIRVYLSTDPTINSLDRLVGDWHWPTFWGDSYFQGDLTGSVPLDTPPGTYYVGLRVSLTGDGYTPNNATFLREKLTITCDGMFGVSPASSSVLKGGLSSSVALNTIGTGCPWTASSSDASWLHVTTPSGTGPGTISFSVDANLTASQRTATISAMGGSHAVTQEAGCVVSVATLMSVWTTVNGGLSTANCLSSQRDLSGLRPYAARYSFSGVAGRQIAIALTGMGTFNTYVYLLDPQGAMIAQDDNGGGFTDSRIPASSGVITLPSTGIYTIEVTSSTVGATGTFTLSLMGSVKLTVSPDPVAGSCKTSKGTIKLGTPAPTGGVTLNVIHTLTAATMPATFTIPAGVSSKAFVITTSAVAATQTGSISASWGGGFGVIGTDSLTIRPIQPLSLVLSPPAVNEGSASTATVTLECAAAPGGITLALSTSKSLWAKPASSTLTMPAGSTSATFQVNTFDVSIASAVTVGAAANGKKRTAKLTINPIP